MADQCIAPIQPSEITEEFSQPGGFRTFFCLTTDNNKVSLRSMTEGMTTDTSSTTTYLNIPQGIVLQHVTDNDNIIQGTEANDIMEEYARSTGDVFFDYNTTYQIYRRRAVCLGVGPDFARLRTLADFDLTVRSLSNHLTTIVHLNIFLADSLYQVDYQNPPVGNLGSVLEIVMNYNDGFHDITNELADYANNTKESREDAIATIRQHIMALA